MITTRSRRGLPRRLTPVLTILLVAASCGDSSDPPVAADAAPTTVAAAVTTTEATTTTSRIPAAPSLEADLAAIPSAYSFTSVTLVDDDEVLRIEGRRIDGDTELDVSSNGALLHYVVAADGSTWVRTDGEETWAVDDALTIDDPLEPLRHPTEVRWESSDANTRIYRADYEAWLFALPEGPPITLFISARSDQILYRYKSGSTTVDLTLVSAPDLAAIEIPTEVPAG